MKLLFLLLTFIFFNAYAEDDCVFSDTAYFNFIKQYTAENKSSKVKNDGKTLLVKRNSEEILVKGGGCNHMGMSITLQSKKKYTEKEFLKKTHALSAEFGSWLINIKALESSIFKNHYQVINGIYFIPINAMTVFSASYDGKGNIDVDYYIN